MEEGKVPPNEVPPHDGLCDELGPIPMFPPLRHDEKGRIIPLTPEERKARSEGRHPCARGDRQSCPITILPVSRPSSCGIDENLMALAGRSSRIWGSYPWRNGLARLGVWDWRARDRGIPPVHRRRAGPAVLESVGVLVLIPSVCDYEVRRELVRVQATAR